MEIIREVKLLDEIDLFQLKDVIERYNSEPSFKVSSGDPLYLETVEKRSVWENLDKISREDVNKIVLNFLNKWKCRIPYKCAPRLQMALQKTHTLFSILKDEKLEALDFCRVTVTGDRIKDVIKQIFVVLSKVKVNRKTIGFTATTKIMHMVLPDLFVMCDENIRRAYGCEGNSEGYFNFLRRMQKSAQGLIKEKPKAEICKELHKGDRSLNKILDEYNYYTITWQQRSRGKKIS